MKKSLLAVAAIGAFASAAQAQSSVTVYGILDVGYVGTNSRLSSSAITNGGQAKTTGNQFGAGGEQSNRLGFKGVEDLGNGTSAFFTTEFQLYPESTNLSGDSNGGLLNRQTFVGLKKNGIGQTAIGLQYTPVFNAAAATDVGELNNMAGNLVYSATPTGSAGTAAGVGGSINNAAFTNRTSNTLSLKSDTFAGFSASAIYTLNNRNSTQANSTTGGNVNASGWGLGADYTLNKFYIAAAYQALKQLTTASNYNPTVATSSTTGAVTVTGTNPWTNAGQTSGVSATGDALNVQDNQFYAGATYDFGILKAYAQYVNRKATSTASTNFYLKRSAEQIGVRSYITPTVEAWASAALGRYQANGANQPTANMNGWQLGSNYYLSKRTNLYAIYGQTLTSNAAAATTTTSSGYSNYAIGVRHTF
ncbi:porin [Polynucleobacter sp. UK-Gri1-W3]|uniref:porin n=1 Tax=Polynucleobacter sp. UK-Gri1-W3 TaxID=1819737 RepID=UPI001C0AA3EF|nr:porin [Polynucleobacter sp. UK-Gri1-W3]MBU3537810.1 porin [Polynucleobacter sp. UK-Gri1-W3]